MKITATCIVALTSASTPQFWRDDELNADACIYEEVDGITTVTTIERLMMGTKCYKKFSCDGGRNVMAKVNQMGLGSHGIGDQNCNANFIKFEYTVPREGDTDYAIEDQFCDAQFSSLELGEWRTMDDHVWFSFEFTDPEYYDWFYGYSDYMGWEVETKSKFEIEFKCSEPVETTTEFATTEFATTDPPTTPIIDTIPTEPAGNQAYNRLEYARNNWNEMISRSTMGENAKTRTTTKFNRLCDKIKARHDKLTEAGCYFQKNDAIWPVQFLDYDDTCTTSGQLIQGIFSPCFNMSYYMTGIICYI